MLLEVGMSLVMSSVFEDRNSMNRDGSKGWIMIKDGVFVGSLSRSFCFISEQIYIIYA